MKKSWNYWKISAEGMESTKGKTLEERVTNNEKKITVIKRIIKIQQQPFAGGTLEEVNRILEDIGNALALDFRNRITQRENEVANLKASAESKRRGGIESGLETFNKISKKVNSAFGAVVAPARGILDKILGFFGNLAAGFVADKALKWLSNNKEAVIGFFQFLQDHGKKILIALGVFIGSVIAVKVVQTIVAVVKFIKGTIFFIQKALQIARMLLNHGPAALARIGKMTSIVGKTTKETVEVSATALSKSQKVAQKTGLKAWGMFPVLGNVIDVGMGFYRASQGDWTGAGLSFGSAIPGPWGWAFAATDIGRDVVQMQDQDLKPLESELNSIEVREMVKQSGMSNLGGQSGGGNEDSLPRTSATDMSNREIIDTLERLGIYSY